MKKLLALVVIAGSITLFSCGNGAKKADEQAKMKADSTRMADSTAQATRAADSMKAAAAKMDTTKKAMVADTTKKAPADNKMNQK